MELDLFMLSEIYRVLPILNARLIILIINFGFQESLVGRGY